MIGIFHPICCLTRPSGPWNQLRPSESRFRKTPSITPDSPLLPPLLPSRGPGVACRIGDRDDGSRIGGDDGPEDDDEYEDEDRVVLPVDVLVDGDERTFTRFSADDVRFRRRSLKHIIRESLSVSLKCQRLTCVTWSHRRNSIVVVDPGESCARMTWSCDCFYLPDTPGN